MACSLFGTTSACRVLLVTYFWYLMSEYLAPLHPFLIFRFLTFYTSLMPYKAYINFKFPNIDNTVLQNSTFFHIGDLINVQCFGVVPRPTSTNSLKPYDVRFPKYRDLWRSDIVLLFVVYLKDGSLYYEGLFEPIVKKVSRMRNIFSKECITLFCLLLPN